MISDERLHACGLSRPAVLLFGPLIRVLLAVLVLAFGARQALVYSEIARTTVTIRHMGDFDVFYRSSQRVAQRLGNPYDVLAVSGTSDPVRTPNLNPPHVVLFLVPLTLFTPRTALLTWTAGSVCSALLALWIIFREVPIRLTPTAATWTLFALLWAAPTGILLFAAQISWLLWGPVTWVWAAARNARWKRAGFVLGVTVSIKPFLALLLVILAVRRRWAALAIAMATAVACFSIGIVALGWPTFVAWICALRSITWAAHVFNASLFGFFERLFGHHPQPIWNLAPMANSPALIGPLWILAASGVLAASLWAVSASDSPDAAAPADRSAFAVDRMFAVTLAGALLISPLAWSYYLFLPVGPFVALCADGRWWTGLGWRKVLFLCGVFALTLSPGILASAQPNGWATLSIGSAYFWSLLAFWTSALPGRGVITGSLTAMRPAGPRPGAPRAVQSRGVSAPGS